METISQDVKNISAYVYDLSYNVSHFLNDKNKTEDISVRPCNECGSLPHDPPPFAEGEYSLQCEQINGSSVPRTDNVQHEEMSVWDVGTINNVRAENTEVLALFTGGLKILELPEHEENTESCDVENLFVHDRNNERIPQRGTARTPDESCNANPSTSDFTDDIKDEIDILEDFSPFQEKADVPVTIEAPDLEVTKNGANFVVKEEAIDTEETPLSKFKEETASSTSNLLCEDPVKDETVDVNLVYEQQSTAHMTQLSEHHFSAPETCEINSAYLMSRISIQNKSEEAHRENGELVKGCSREYPQEGCSDTAASFSCSVEPLRVQDVAENDQSEKCSRKCSGVGERRPKKSMPCNRKTRSSSSNKTSSKQSGRQKQTRKPFCCDTCCKCFPSMFHLENHKRKHTREKHFCCALCNKACATKSNLAYHMKVHSEERSYKCSTCNKSFKRGDELVNHMRLHSGEKPFECSVCKKAFTQRTSVITHMRTHTGKKPYKCTECGKAFTHSGALTCHMRMHSGEKPFVCRECGKAFTQSSNLRTHMRTHTGECPFHCKNCESSFTQSNSLKRHMRIVHRVASPVS